MTACDAGMSFTHEYSMNYDTKIQLQILVHPAAEHLLRARSPGGGGGGSGGGRG